MSKCLVEHLIDASAPSSRAAWTSVLFPTEILYAFDVYPITLEVIGGTFATMGLATPFLDIAESDDVPPTMCSFHKILLGLSSTDFLEKPLCIAATSTMCDGNVKSFSEAAKNQNIPFIFIDVPYELSKASVTYVKEQLQSLLKDFAEMTGVKDYKQKLSKIVLNANKSFALARKYYELNKTNRKNIIKGHELANFAFPMHFLLGTDRLVQMLDCKCKDVKEGTKFNKFYKTLHFSESAKRIMWLHIVPQYETEMWSIIDNGESAKVVCDEYSSPYFEDYDLADPLRSIAKRMINHPSNGPLERRINHILKVAKDFKVDGMIHYSSWGCHQASGNVQILGKKIQDAGYKFLNLNGDATDQRNTSFEQHRTRLEAFLEH